MPPSADGGFLVGVQGSTVYLFGLLNIYHKISHFW